MNCWFHRIWTILQENETSWIIEYKITFRFHARIASTQYAKWIQTNKFCAIGRYKLKLCVAVGASFCMKIWFCFCPHFFYLYCNWLSFNFPCLNLSLCFPSFDSPFYFKPWQCQWNHLSMSFQFLFLFSFAEIIIENEKREER